MADDGPETPAPSLPLLIQRYKIELQRLLQGAAYAVKNDCVITERYEGEIEDKARSLQFLEKLKEGGWELAELKKDRLWSIQRQPWTWRGGRILLAPWLVKEGILADLVELRRMGIVPEHYNYVDHTYIVRLHDSKEIAVKAKHLPLPACKLEFARLKDGYAWLTGGAKEIIAKALKGVKLVSEP